jgi:cytochrome c oxidase assembly protein subunit 11
MPSSLKNRNNRTLLVLLALVAGMLGLAYASPTLYRVFCQVTGLGGTTQRAESAPAVTLDRVMKVEFNADVHPSIDWEFAPDQRSVKVKLGEEKLITFHARNIGSEPTKGVAIYNVVPLKAGKYFAKTQCFCFEGHTLKTGETGEFPVVFFIDPALAEDPDMEDVTSITLSYTFFQDHTEALERAKDKFYQESN